MRADGRVVAPLEERLAQVARRRRRGGTRPVGAEDLQPPDAQEADEPRHERHRRLGHVQADRVHPLLVGDPAEQLAPEVARAAGVVTEADDAGVGVQHEERALERLLEDLLEVRAAHRRPVYLLQRRWPAEADHVPVSHAVLSQLLPHRPQMPAALGRGLHHEEEALLVASRLVHLVLVHAHLNAGVLRSPRRRLERGVNAGTMRLTR